MNVRVVAMSCVVGLAVAGCGPQLQSWQGADGSSTGAKQALAECEYEAKSATANRGTAASDGTTGVAGAVGAGVERGMEESDLIESCMKARGFSAG